VDTGNTLRANGLTVLETITGISARLIVNKAAMKLKNLEVKRMLAAFARAATQGPPISSEQGTP
ncbi:MAG: hypothetical protein LC647_04335, partial [Beggiatoa sp.]|nr:hypothetical protein [Beggiatoa sp.]